MRLVADYTWGKTVIMITHNQEIQQYGTMPFVSNHHKYSTQDIFKQKKRLRRTNNMRRTWV